MGAALQQGDLGRILLGSEASGITSLLTYSHGQKERSQYLYHGRVLLCVPLIRVCCAYRNSHTLGVVVRGGCVNFRFP